LPANGREPLSVATSRICALSGTGARFPNLTGLIDYFISALCHLSGYVPLDVAKEEEVDLESDEEPDLDDDGCDDEDNPLDSPIRSDLNR
jgi:hypothetical protein